MLTAGDALAKTLVKSQKVTFWSKKIGFGCFFFYSLLWMLLDCDYHNSRVIVPNTMETRTHRSCSIQKLRSSSLDFNILELHSSLPLVSLLCGFLPQKRSPFLCLNFFFFYTILFIREILALKSRPPILPCVIL